MKRDEGPRAGGNYGPYRQSERKHIYIKYAEHLVDSGKAYYAFDTPEELNAMRERLKTKENPSPQYDSGVRRQMKNSLTLSEEEQVKLLADGAHYVIRMKMPENETITFTDAIRGEVSFQSSVLDDKVLFKSDGMPTYHLANVVDDHLMKISHVIRGEEWLPSVPLHVLLYRYLGWEETMPTFAHLPLILKPEGKGKLSKRDGDRLGFPVFPLDWQDGDEISSGFKELGFLPGAFNNLLAMLGWNPGDDREVFAMDDLAAAFDLAKVQKGGARFDFEKAKWFNQQHLLQMENSEIADLLKSENDTFLSLSGERLNRFVELLKPRATFLKDFWEMGAYFFSSPNSIDQKALKKRWKDNTGEILTDLKEELASLNDFTAKSCELTTKAFLEKNEYGFGQVFPAFRLAISGTMQGPDLIEIAAFIGQEETIKRMENAIAKFPKIKAEMIASNQN